MLRCLDAWRRYTAREKFLVTTERELSYRTLVRLFTGVLFEWRKTSFHLKQLATLR